MPVSCVGVPPVERKKRRPAPPPTKPTMTGTRRFAIAPARARGWAGPRVDEVAKPRHAAWNVTCSISAHDPSNRSSGDEHDTFSVHGCRDDAARTPRTRSDRSTRTHAAPWPCRSRSIAPASRPARSMPPPATTRRGRSGRSSRRKAARQPSTAEPRDRIRNHQRRCGRSVRAGAGRHDGEVEAAGARLRLDPGNAGRTVSREPEAAAAPESWRALRERRTRSPVPNVEPFIVPAAAAATTATASPGQARAAKKAPGPPVTVTVTDSTKSLEVKNEAGETVFFAPVTVGSEHDPLPVGEWKVTGVSSNPPFNYNPDCSGTPIRRTRRRRSRRVPTIPWASSGSI